MKAYDRRFVEEFVTSLIGLLDRAYREETPISFDDRVVSTCHGRREKDGVYRVTKIRFSHSVMEWNYSNGYMEGYKSLEWLVPAVRPQGMEAVLWHVLHEYAHAVQMREDQYCAFHEAPFVRRYQDLLKAFTYAKVMKALGVRNASIRLYWAKQQLREEIRQCRSTGGHVRFLTETGDLLEGKLLKSTNGVFKVTDAMMTKVWTVDAQAIEFC